MSELSPQPSKLIMPSSSEVARYSGGNKNRSYDSYDERLGQQVKREADQLAYKDIINPANVLDLKESIRRRTERELNSGPANLRLDQDSAGIKESIKKELIESYLHTADRNKERVIPDEIREQLAQLVSLSSKQLEAKLPVPQAPEPKAAESNPGQPDPSEDLTQLIPVIKVESSQKSAPSTAPASETDKSGRFEKIRKALKEKLNRRRAAVATAIAITALAGVFGAGSVSKKSTARAAGIGNTPTLTGKDSLLSGLPELNTNDLSKDINANPQLPTQLQMGSEQWDSQARHEDHEHNKTVEDGFKQGDTPEQAGKQMERFMNHRGEVLSIFMYAAKNGISVDKARAHIGDISEQTKKITTKNGQSLTSYGEEQAKAAQELMKHAKFSWVSGAELQDLYNSGVLENQNLSGRDDRLAINQAPGFDASVKVLKVELENGKVIYLKDNCANFLWKGAPQREVLTTFTYKGRNVNVTVPPSRSPVTPSTPRQPKQPHQPHQPKQPYQPSQPTPTVPTTPTPPETPPGGLTPKDPTKDINVNPDLDPQEGMGDVRVDTGEQKPATPPPPEYTPPAPPVSTEPAPGAEPAPPVQPPAPEEGTGTSTNPNNGTVGPPQ